MKASELTNKKTPEVYLDLDGVVADFFDRYAELAIIRLMMEKYNKSEAEAREVYHKNEELWRTEFGIRSYRDIPPAKGDPVLNMMIGTDFFNRLPKFASADTLVSYLVQTFGSYKVLSSPLRNDYENSEKWKKVWVARELNPPPAQVIIEHKKEKYAKQPDGTPNILIDDRGNNITNWEAKGGIGIKYQADENGLDVVYKGIERAFKIINGEEEHVPQVLKSIDRTQTIATANDQPPQTVKESLENKEEFLEMFRKFFLLTIKILKLKSLPKMKFEFSVDDAHQPTFGKFDHHNNELYVALGNRHPNDILRTLAHELVHFKQGTQHRLDNDSGETGSEEENEANAVAGIIMRHFNKRYPEYLKQKPIMLEGRRRKKKKWAAYGPGPYGWYGYDAGYSGDSGIEEMARPPALSDEQVQQMAKLFASGETFRGLARVYKVAAVNVKKILLRVFGEKKYDELEQQHLANTKYPKSGRLKGITPEQVQQMAKLFVSGITLRELERVYKVSDTSIKNSLLRVFGEKKYNELEQQHLANTKYPEKRGPKGITPEQAKEMYDLYIAGDKTFEAIGHKFGVDQVNVQYHVSKIAKRLYGPDGYNQVRQIRKANIENRNRLGPTTISGGSGLAEDNSSWMYGHCHVMALALKSLHPQWQLRAHVGWDEETEDDEDYRVDHVFVVNPETGEAYDCRGKFNSEQELVGSELMASETQIVDYSLEDIKSDIRRGELKSFSKKDLENAKAFIEKNRIVLEGVAHSLPVVLFHGGNIPIKKFNVPKHGAYFSPHKKWAKGYGDVITPVKINAKNVYLADYTNDIDEEIADALFDRDYQTVAKFIKLLQAKGYDALQTVTDSEMVVAFPGTEVKVINVEEGLSWSSLGDDLSVEDKILILEEHWTKGNLFESNNDRVFKRSQQKVKTQLARWQANMRRGRAKKK